MQIRKVPSLIIALSVIVCASVIFNACKKDYSEKGGEEFTQSFVKEWYYGLYKKSGEWQQSSEKGKKLPDWNNGAYRKAGKIEIIEFPLIKEKTVLSISDAGSLSSAEIDRIMSASLTRIAFIKSPDGAIVVREIDYIPTADYLNTKGFDISSLEIGTDNFDFTGRIIVKKWDGRRVSSYKVENGKFLEKGVIKVVEANASSTVLPITSTNNADGCSTYEVCEYERECEEVHHGDAWIPTGECSPWQMTGNCWTEEYCNGTGCDESMSTQQCSCMLLGLGCEDDGDHDPPPPEPDPCTKAQPGADKAKAVSQTTDYANGKTAVQSAAVGNSLEHTVAFGKDANGNVVTSSVSNGTGNSGQVGGVPNRFADLHNHPGELPPSSGDLYGFIDSSKDHSQYETRYIITPSGVVYALIVTDRQAADSFNIKYPRYLNPPFEPEFPDDLRDKYRNVRDDAGGSDELATAFILDKYNAGVALLKQDSNGNFKKLRTTETVLPNGSKSYTANNCP